MVAQILKLCKPKIYLKILNYLRTFLVLVISKATHESCMNVDIASIYFLTTAQKVSLKFDKLNLFF
ncbi:protein of unknown function [Acetoanaerobium sticklandii]|uniref:Uncharacterized protein n=1 Tax=Acetoanaerobium sticklandii (strain ATCC 12662 / DSM 519 / JCM 1433 / CCUG 9281 / NCIMB 10654 / HF) TaxID=499177 RepID=E3PUV4_ACESD|nr:protein of unknown function [Acetoanaerobium sticklandii]